jgi:rhodanese-related sulfurtransferase
LLFAKFVPGLDGVTPPLAGMEGCGMPAFVLLDAIGSLCWSGAYVVIGYFFANQIGEVLHLLRASAHVLALTDGVPLFIYVALRASRLIRMIQRLRLKTMTPHLLDQKLKEHEKVAVIDLLEFEDSTAAVEGIPGAVRIDPSRLRRRNKVVIPEDLQVVLYSSSLHEVISARVAVALRRRGIKNVWVLDGGLSGWKAAGFPTTMNLNSVEESNARLGISVLSYEEGLYQSLRSRWRARAPSQSTRRP